LRLSAIHAPLVDPFAPQRSRPDYDRAVAPLFVDFAVPLEIDD